MTTYRWTQSEVPSGLEVRQVYGFIFNPVGQVLLLNDNGTYNLPGGQPENGESYAETFIREASEEVQVTITSIEYLGFQLIIDTDEYAQVRVICQLGEILPSEPDRSTGRTYSRHWVSPERANDLLDWGDSGRGQIASAIIQAQHFN